MLKLFVICVFLSGCTSMNQLTYEEMIIDSNDPTIDAECALKNSVPDIHDQILWGK